jgi:peptidyl-prolyl cis-trans isomerase D
MWKALQQREVLTRILLGIVVVMLAAGMLIYLVPGQGGSSGGTGGADVVAEVGGQPITALEVETQLRRLTRNGNVPPGLQPLYVQQIVNQLLFLRMIELEAKRLGIRVTDQERAERIRLLIPTAFVGDSFVGIERYAAEVQQRTGLSVPEFEEVVRQSLLQEKFQHLVTDGISVTPEEMQEEFRRRNEKIKIEYVLIKPDALEAKISPSDAELSAYFEQNKGRYTVPERRVVRYALLDLDQLRQRAAVSEPELRAYYNDHIDLYRVQNRARVSHILFKTVGKTDAEVEEIRKKAEEVLKKVKHGAKFEDLAKQYSEDTTKDKGGDLGWIVQGQTVPEFEQVAFNLPKGTVSDLVKTPYGFHIIKVVDREAARTKSFEEVRGAILPLLTGEKADRLANETADQITAEVRKTTRGSLDELAKKFNLTVGETRPLSPTDPVPEVGNAPELRDTISRLRVGDLSYAVRTERGYVVLAVKEVLPTHPAALAEVRDKLLADYRHEQAVELAKARANELAKRAQSGEALTTAAMALGLEVKTSEPLARSGSVPDAGSARQLPRAFSLAVGQTGPPTLLRANWIVYRVVAHDPAKPEEFEKQRAEVERQVLESKRQLAFDSFRLALEERMKREGKLKIMPENLRRLTRAT